MEEIIRQNLTRVFKDRFPKDKLLEITRDNILKFHMRYKIIKQFAEKGEEDIDRFIIEESGLKNLSKALDSKRGVLLLSIHFFCCDLGLIWLSQKGFDVNLVYDYTEAAKDGLLSLETTFNNQGVNLIRSARSFKVKTKTNEYVFIDKTLDKIMSCLKNNEIVAMLSDMHPGKDSKGVYVDFLGLPTFVSYAPILIAKMTGAKILPATVLPSDSNTYRIVFHPCLELVESKDVKLFLKQNMQQYMDFVAGYVLEYPEEYCWYQADRWER